MRSLWFISLILGAACCPGIGLAQPATPDYARDIAPIFARACLSCHGPQKQESNLRLDQPASIQRGGDWGEKLVVAGKPDASFLLQVVSDPKADLVMPPKGPRLAPADIALLKAWIEQGAKWPVDQPDAPVVGAPDHWSLRPLVCPSVPAVPPPDDARLAHWPGNAVDAFVLEKLRENGLTPSPPQTREKLIRRLYLDVLGLAPTPQEVAAFVADKRPDAYERLVDQALASPRYGERWARHWLDVVRFAETNGFETNTPRPSAWHYRDWVIRAFNADLPYDRFVLAQLAGDQAADDAATGFLVAGAYDVVKSPDINLTLMQRQDELADIINTTSTALLGLTVGCARCHNHKFDPISQRDYYALQAVFAGVQHGERMLRTPEVLASQQRAAELQGRMAQLESQLASLGAVAPARVENLPLVMDDETRRSRPGVEALAKIAGHGVNPPGAERGQQDDEGDVDRLPNISGGRYTWWQARPRQELFAWRPNLKGTARVWLSWGTGFKTHATNAEYWLDRDGDVATKDDRTLVARINQQHFADGFDNSAASQPLWSGLKNAGVHEFAPESCLLLQAGASEAAVTADVVVFEPTENAKAPAPVTPLLRPSVQAQQNVEVFAPVTARYVRFTVLATNQYEPCLDELEVFSVATESSPAQNVALASNGAKATSSGDYSGNPIHQLPHVHDGLYGNSHSWISNQMGAGWVQIELAEPMRIDRIIWGRDRDQKYRDRLATRYVIEVAERPDQWQRVASSDDRLPPQASGVDPPALRLAGLSGAAREAAAKLLTEIQQLRREVASLARETASAYVGTFSQPTATHRLYRGDPLAPREEVLPDTVAVVGKLELSANAPEAARRQALAAWIVSDENPLAARVMANRLWQHHFGTGIVATSSDFGRMGSAPSHQKLLDYLACELRAGGWSLKRLHRLILTSATYQQSGQPNAAALKVDAGSRLLWRFPPRRLEAEAIRDNVLAASGALDLGMYGPGYSVFEPNENYVRVYNPRTSWGPADWRRMIYMTKIRMEHDPVFGNFDCPDAGLPAPTRARSTTAIQSLNLFNSTFIQQQAELMASRLEREAPANRSAQIARAFAITVGRDPSGDELSAAQIHAADHGLPSLCRVLLNTNEFLFLP